MSNGIHIGCNIPQEHHEALKRLRPASGRRVSLQEILLAAVADVVNSRFAEDSATHILLSERARKLEVPPIMPGRPTINYVGWSSVMYQSVNTYLPIEWHEVLTRLAAEKCTSVEKLVRRQLAQYFSEAELDARAEAKGVATNYEKRDLLQYIFPELPLCDFSKCKKPRPRRKPKGP